MRFAVYPAKADACTQFKNNFFICFFKSNKAEHIMLKRINLGLVALVLGFGLVFTQSAFKAQKSNREQFTFRYTGPSAMTKSQVENVANWTYDSDNLSCPAGPAEACSILVDESHVNNPDTAPTLNSSASIDAEPGLGAKYRVNSVADGTPQNKAEQ